jgi:hypothetical protein
MLVECRSDTEYAERPVAIHWQELRLEIVEIIARWRTPDSKCFRVRSADDQIFELTYDQASNHWQIHQP